MTMLIGQMLGCLIIAAGIGGAVGWLLRQLSAGALTGQLLDITTRLRIKEQAVEKLQQELNARTAELQILESTAIELEGLNRSTREELSSRHDQVLSLQEELAAVKNKLSNLESGQVRLLACVSDSEAVVQVQAQEIRESKAALEIAQRTLALKHEELASLETRLALLEQYQTDIDRLRARIEDLEPAQGRVHWLEVQLSERETQHRAAVHDMEEQLAVRDFKIAELEPFRQQQLAEETARSQREAAYAQAVQRVTDETARSQQLRADIVELKAQLNKYEERLCEKDARIATLQREINGFESVQSKMVSQVKLIEEKEEQISHLRKRLFEIQAAIRIRADGGIAPNPVQPTGNQLSLQISQQKTSTAHPKDNLKEIRGIGPAFERVLNSMGIVTFQQVAQWDASTLKQIADKLDTVPERIKRDKWMASAKKLHQQKYGTRL